MNRFWQHLIGLFVPSTFEIYTDGSFKDGRGAWAYVVVKNGQIIQEDSGSCKRTSSNRMEFQAAIEALTALPVNSRVMLYTDSRIMLEALKNASAWEQSGWVKSAGQPIPNVDLIRELFKKNQQHRIVWRWVKAHSGIEFNERCDELCIRARTEQWRP